MALVVAPLRVLAQGYLPGDDALRHAAKAVGGRSWTEILLLRPEITLDSNPGWHALLGALHRFFGLGAVDLVLASVALLFVLFSLGPVLLLRRPAACCSRSPCSWWPSRRSWSGSCRVGRSC